MNNNTKRIIEQLKKGLDITNIQLADALSVNIGGLLV